MEYGKEILTSREERKAGDRIGRRPACGVGGSAPPGSSAATCFGPSGAATATTWRVSDLTGRNMVTPLRHFPKGDLPKAACGVG